MTLLENSTIKIPYIKFTDEEWDKATESQVLSTTLIITTIDSAVTEELVERGIKRDKLSIAMMDCDQVRTTVIFGRHRTDSRIPEKCKTFQDRVISVLIEELW